MLYGQELAVSDNSTHYGPPGPESTKGYTDYPPAVSVQA
jgi:hypothetical protein